MTNDKLTEVKGGLLLDVIVGEGAAILELLASEDQALLVGRDALLVLNFGLDVIDSVGGLDLEGDGLARQGLNKDLHSTAETEDQVEGRLLLDVTAEALKAARRRLEGKRCLLIAQGTTVLKLLAGKDQALLVGRDALLVLNFGLDIVDGVRGLDLKGDGLSSESLNEDLHAEMWRGAGRGSGGCR